MLGLRLPSKYQRTAYPACQKVASWLRNSTFAARIDGCQGTYKVKTASEMHLESCHPGIFLDGEIHQCDTCEHQCALIGALDYCSCCVPLRNRYSLPVYPLVLLLLVPRLPFSLLFA